jgi:hypothetical protein
MAITQRRHCLCSQIENENHEIVIRNGPHVRKEFKIRNSFENRVINMSLVEHVMCRGVNDPLVIRKRFHFVPSDVINVHFIGSSAASIN